jgi:hypothetical protein
LGQKSRLVIPPAAVGRSVAGRWVPPITGHLAGSSVPFEPLGFALSFAGIEGFALSVPVKGGFWANPDEAVPSTTRLARTRVKAKRVDMVVNSPRIGAEFDAGTANQRVETD